MLFTAVSQLCCVWLYKYAVEELADYGASIAFAASVVNVNVVSRQ
jgi:hypothetical protein